MSDDRSALKTIAQLISAYFNPTAVSGVSRVLMLSACSSVLIACSHAPLKQDQADSLAPKVAANTATPASPVANAKTETDDDDEDAKPSVDESLPKQKLTDELLYKIVTAEIAFQRGSWQAAYVTLYSLAQQTRDPRLARRCAEIALAVRQSNEALAAIRLWRELAPQSAEATQYYLGFMVMYNNLAEIQTIYTEKLKQAQPTQYAALMLQVQRLLARARDKKAAFASLEALLQPYLASPDAHLALAQAAQQMNDSSRAVQEARLVLEKRSDSQLAILTLAQASKPEAAAQELENFLQKHPEAREVRLAYGSILLELKRYLQATVEFQRLLKDKPDDYQVMYTLGILAMEAGQNQQAETYLRNYLSEVEKRSNEASNDPSNALLNLARLALARKDYNGAHDWLAQVESFDGRNPAWLTAQLRRANLYAEQGNLQQARDFLHKIKVNTEAEHVQLVQAEASLLKESGDQQGARKVLLDALQQIKEQPDLMYDLAMLAEARNDLDEMETYLRRLIVIAPQSQHAYNALGYSLADRNIKLDEALQLIQKANELAPDDPYILDSLGWVKFRLGRHDEAEQVLRRAYELRADAEIAAHLGEVLWARGQRDQARTLWRDALGKNPDSSNLKNTLQRLQVNP